MATVKGDVHDIGKNIVGVVLQCNNYEVIDLGVMVPAEKILETAREEKADIIGLSGLITPSLDEMVDVAAEMKRQGFEIPLLIGGATTRSCTPRSRSRRYDHGAVIHVPDASRGVGVVEQAAVASRPRRRTSPRSPASYERDPRAPRAREQGTARWRPSRRRAPTASPPTGRATHRPGPRSSASRASTTTDLAELVARIDWTPFFQTWELAGRYPAILDDPKVGEAARELFDDAQRHAARGSSTSTGSGRARVIGFWPGQPRRRRHRALHGRGARGGAGHGPHPAPADGPQADGAREPRLADFVAPADSGVADWIGGFAVTAGVGTDEIAPSRSRRSTTTTTRSWSRRWPTGWPRPSPSACTSACAREFWGYAPDEELANEELIAETYRGIRPAPGYPACPDHTEKRDPVRPARRAGAHRHHAHRELRHVARLRR